LSSTRAPALLSALRKEELLRVLNDRGELGSHGGRAALDADRFPAALVVVEPDDPEPEAVRARLELDPATGRRVDEALAERHFMVGGDSW
jgi:hypothetical protein